MTLPPIPQILVDAIRRGNCVLFVGAGLSQAAGLPGWKGLLNRLLSWYEQNSISVPNIAEIRELIERGDLLLAAEAIKDATHAEMFRRALLDAIDETHISLTPTHLLLPEFPFAAVLTSNYDKLLETAYTRVVQMPRVLTHSNTPELMASLSDQRFYILKAHGTIDQIETIILGSRSYRELMHANEAYREHLKTVFRTKTVFFVGFSLSDPDLRLILDREQIISKGYMNPHYALMNSREMTPLVQKEWEQDYGIQLLLYEPSNEYHPEVEEFLKELARQVAEPDTASTQQAIQPAANSSEEAIETTTLPETIVSGERSPGQLQIGEAISALNEFTGAEDFASGVRLPGEVDDFQLLRLQLLITTWQSSLIPSSMLSSHEANRLYIHRARLQTTSAELVSLLRMLVNDTLHYIPGWYWFNEIRPANVEAVILHLAFTDPSHLVRQRAFDLLSSAKIPLSDEVRERMSWVVTSEYAAEVRKAALSYIGSVAGPAYLPVVGSAMVDRERVVSRQARVSKYLLLARSEPDRALSELLDETGVEVEDILSEMTLNVEGIATATLLKALSHSIDGIRFFAVKELARRGELTVELVTSLKEDKYDQIKAVAYRSLVELGAELDAEELAYKLPSDYFTRHISRSSYLKPGPPIGRDQIILEFYRRYGFDQLIQMTDWGQWSGHEVYRTLGLEHFPEFAARLREDLRTDFAATAEVYYHRQLAEWQRINMTPYRPENLSVLMPPLISLMAGRKLERSEKDVHTPESMAQNDVEGRKIYYIASALAGLAQNGSSGDIEFGRQYLFHSDTDVRIEAVKIIQRFGNAEDVPGLVRLAKSSDGLLQELSARAAIVISGEQLEVATEFLATGDEVLVSITVVELIARGEKDAIGNFLLSYLSSDNEKIRTRVMAFYVFRYDEEQLKDLLAQYTSGVTYYYDVACCFDRMLYAPARLKSVYRELIESSFLGLVIPDSGSFT